MPRNYFTLQKIAAKNAAKNAAIIAANNAAYKAALNNQQFFVIHKSQLATMQASKATKSKTGCISALAIFNNAQAALAYISNNNLRLYTVFSSAN